jgi:hypothetical protein
MINKIFLSIIITFLSTMSFAQTKGTRTKSKSNSQKTYINMCGKKYEKGTNFESMLPDGWEDRVGYYFLKNYREGVSSVYVSGANSKGILIKAVGENTGESHLVLYTCDGDLF